MARASLRDDAALLVPHFVPGASVKIDRVLIHGDEALVYWSWSDPRVKDVNSSWQGTQSMAATFRHHANGWWLTRNYGVFRPTPGSGAADLAKMLNVSTPSARVFLSERPSLKYDMFIERTKAPWACAACLPTVYDDTDQFDATFGYNPANAAWPSGLTVTYRGGAPAGNALYDFTIGTGLPIPVQFAGVRLEVWFPFVLDRGQRYAMSIDSTIPAVANVAGTLEDNTLTFAARDFKVLPSIPIRGHIGYLSIKPAVSEGLRALPPR